MTKHDQMGDQLQAFYLDYLQNYRRASCIAEDNGLTVEDALTLIDMGRTIHNIRVGAWEDCQNLLELYDRVDSGGSKDEK